MSSGWHSLVSVAYRYPVAQIVALAVARVSLLIRTGVLTTDALRKIFLNICTSKLFTPRVCKQAAISCKFKRDSARDASNSGASRKRWMSQGPRPCASLCTRNTSRMVILRGKLSSVCQAPRDFGLIQVKHLHAFDRENARSCRTRNLASLAFISSLQLSAVNARAKGGSTAARRLLPRLCVLQLR